MAQHNSHISADSLDSAFDLSQIFIGRQQQLDFFEIYLNRWKKLIRNTNEESTRLTAVPSPYNRIPGLVVLLYGRGGFGKTTLLRRYREIALQDEYKLSVSNVVDWEFAIEGKHSLFNLTEDQEVDPFEYFKILHRQLAFALNKSPKEFRAYLSAIKEVEEARKKANGVLDGLKDDDNYFWLRELAVDAVTTAVRTYVPGITVVLENATIKNAANAAVKMTEEQISHIRTLIQERLGSKLDDYLAPAPRLGLALGQDLYQFAKNFPLLIFFDTYEEVDEGDRFLRMVMCKSQH